MADPTQGGRDFLKKVFNAVTPDNAPFKSAGGDVLTPEARAKQEEEDKALESTDAAPAETRAPAQVEAAPSFVSPVSQTAVQAQQPAQQIMSTEESGLGKGLLDEARVSGEVGKKEAAAYDQLGEERKKINEQIEANRVKQQEADSQFDKEDEEVKSKIANFELKPTDIFAGKATWQKILGGVGMFLGSITPEGAHNVATMIDKTIDRDIERQKMEFSLLKDKRSEAANRYKMKLDRYGNENLAMLAMKQEALAATEIHLKSIEASAKGPMARARATTGIEALQHEREKTKVAFMTAYAKAQKETNTGMIPGFKGSNPNPGIAKDVYERVAAEKSANASIDKLQNLLAEGSKNPLSANSSLAKQLHDTLAADLAKAMFGRSSDSELEITKGLIPDITSFTRRGATAKVMLNSLRNKLKNDVDAYSSTAGYSRVMPTGAREIK